MKNQQRLLTYWVAGLITTFTHFSISYGGVAPPPPPPPPPPPAEPPPSDPDGPQSSNHGPNLPLNDNVTTTQDRGVDQVFGDPVSAGCNVLDLRSGCLRMFAEYNFLELEDDRMLGFSGEANGFMVGADWIVPNQMVASFAYGYDFRDQNFNQGGGSGFDLETHIVSTSLVKRSQRFECLAYGLSGGYSTADATAFNIAPGTLAGVDAEFWVLNPFIATAKQLGAIHLRSQLGYHHSWSHDDVGKVVASLRGTYDLTECLALTGHAAWHNITNDQGRNFILGQDDDWAEVGGGVLIFPGQCLNFYGDWTHTAANSDFASHRFRLGSNYRF